MNLPAASSEGVDSVARFDPRGFRNVLGTFTTGVTIITTRAEDGQPIGLTANSFNAVSLDPPLVLWSIAKNALSRAAFEHSGHWAVHILSADQQALSDRFAQRGTDKFAGVACENGAGGVPMLVGCCARLQCKTSFLYEGGDHLILVGEVLAYDSSDAAPLVFQAGRYAVATRKAAPLSLSADTSSDAGPTYSENFLGYLLWRSFHQFQRAVRLRVSEAGLSMMEYYALCALVVQDGRTLEEVNAFTGLTGELVDEQTVAQLTAKHLIQHTSSLADRLYLTDAGRDKTLHLMAAGMAKEADVLDKLGYWEALSLKNLLKQLIVHTDAGQPHPWDKLPTH
ncbi:flavin reductase [Variovorax dokdonensis]|uniref:Flavin reductase n=1 Tax=Variovorax dokdonensis TaxID=344883 RepID=A0ABT7N7I3_9BURK|nr:flavin reductase [Variovorax dokdonensis]MDM0043901.1 flavin reductase [Variovorax dokdonensis]